MCLKDIMVRPKLRLIASLLLTVFVVLSAIAYSKHSQDKAQLNAALLNAVMQGKTIEVKSLLDKGANPNAQATLPFSPVALDTKAILCPVFLGHAPCVCRQIRPFFHNAHPFLFRGHDAKPANGRATLGAWCKPESARFSWGNAPNECCRSH